VLLLLVMTGCGDRGAGADPDAGDRPDAAASDAAPAGPPPPRQTADRMVFAQNGGLIRAQFVADDEGPGSCLIKWMNGCEVQDCDYSQEPRALQQAGPITLQSPAATVLLEPNPDTGEYPGNQSISWAAGDAVLIEAAGGDLPAFQTTLRGPADLVAIEPEFSGTLAIDRDAPLEFRWSGGTEMANPGLRCTADGGRAVQVRCPAPAESGEGQIPSEVLQDLPACGSAYVFLMTEHRVELEPDDRHVRVGVRSSVSFTFAEL
jgi:hypothetical protein